MHFWKFVLFIHVFFKICMQLQFKFVCYFCIMFNSRKWHLIILFELWHFDCWWRCKILRRMVMNFLLQNQKYINTHKSLLNLCDRSCIELQLLNTSILLMQCTGFHFFNMQTQIRGNNQFIEKDIFKLFFILIFTFFLHFWHDIHIKQETKPRDNYSSGPSRVHITYRVRILIAISMLICFLVSLLFFLFFFVQILSMYDVVLIF